MCLAGDIGYVCPYNSYAKRSLSLDRSPVVLHLVSRGLGQFLTFVTPDEVKTHVDPR